MKYIIPLLVLALTACGDPELKPPEISNSIEISDNEQQDLSDAVHHLGVLCNNVFSKPDSFNVVSVAQREASPEQKNSYGWDKVFEVELMLDNHPDFKTAIKNNCSFYIGDGRRAGVVSKTSCMEDACRLSPLEEGVGGGKFYEFN